MNSYLNIQVRVITSQAKAMLAQLNSQLRGLGNSNSGAFNTSRLDRFGSQMQWLGRQIEYNFTLPLVLAGSAATKMALDNEAAFTRITKVYGDAAHGADFYKQELDSLKKAFVALSDQFGISQADTLNIAADWAAAGASGLALAKSVQLTMKTMVLGEMDATSATQSLIAIQAQYGLSIGQLSDTIDILNMVENQTGISMKGLIDGFSRTAGVARASGVGVRELAADLAALTPATGSAANAGNALKTIFSRLLSPTKQTVDVLKLMGINTHSMAWESENAQNKLLTMATAFEKLSDSQKGLVSSIIASRYQVNRFEVLMDQLTSTTGYYNRALQSTRDMNAVYAQSQKELNQVLTSSPQRLQIIWNMLKNAAANIIQPLIPTVLWLATAVENLVTAFSHLNPSIQKFILFTLAGVAAVGPIVRYLGAFQVLLSQIAPLFKLLLSPLGSVFTWLYKIVSIPLTLFFQTASIAIRGFMVGVGFVAKGVPALFSVMATVSEAIISGFVATVNFLAVAGWAALVSGTSFALNVVIGLWGLTFGKLPGLVAEGMAAVRAAWTIGLEALDAALMEFAAFSGVVWRLITTNPLGLFAAMWQGISKLFIGAIPFLRTASLAVLDAMTGPIGIAVTAAVLLIILFWNQIKQIWKNAVDYFRRGAGIGDAFKPLGDAAVAVKNVVLRAFNALPNGIQRAMLAVVRTIAAAAKAVYQWFSYINPFAHHSPSLVENVQNGAAVINDHHDSIASGANTAKKAASTVTAAHASATQSNVGTTQNAVAAIQAQFAQLTGVSSAFAQATTDLDKFAEAVKKVQDAADAKKYADIRKELAGIAKDALPAFDRLVAALGPLNNELAQVSKQLDAQQAVVDKLKDSLDSANDALQAQQDVLSAMKDQIDDFSGKVQAINGDLEILTGTREALRQAGAGSDILKGYDDQINALKQQKKGIDDQLSAAQSAYAQQQKLVDDLTAARDKLQASYDLENQKLQEIQKNYDAIKQKIDDITSAIQDFSSAAESLKSSSSGKKDAIGSDFAAGAGGNFPDVGGSGMLGREGGIADQAGQIDDFTKQIQQQTQKLFGMFNFLDPIKKAWNAAWGWVKTTFGPLGSVIGNFFSHLFDGVHLKGKNPFSGIDFSGYLNTIKGMFKTIETIVSGVWKLVGPPLKEIASTIGKEFVQAWKEISPEVAKFKDLIAPLGQALQQLWTIVKPLALAVGGSLLLAFSIVANMLKYTIKPIFDVIIAVIKGTILVIRGIAEVIIGIFTGNLSLVVKGFGDLLSGVFGTAWRLIKDAVQIIVGLVEGLVKGIWNFFKWVYDELVGHSIIPDLVNAITGWFTKMKDLVVAIWNDFVKALKWVWDNILKPIFDGIKAAIGFVKDAFEADVNLIKKAWDLFSKAASAAWNGVKSVLGWIKDRFTDMKNGINTAINIAKGFIDSFVDKITGIKNRIKGAFSGLFDGLKDAFKSAVNWIISKWNNLSFGVGPFKAETPNLPLLARGGLVANQAMAIVGEGRKGFPEYVIPTDPQYRNRAVALFEQLGNDLGFNHVYGSAKVLQTLAYQLTRGVVGDKIQFFASGGMLGSASMRGSLRGGVVFAPKTEHNEFHFHGDLSFPNVKDGGDAEEFVKNLKSLAGR